MRIEDLSYSDINNLIDQWILNERNRQILKRRLLDGITYQSLAEEFDVSITTIKNIVYKGEKKIFKNIK